MGQSASDNREIQVNKSHIKIEVNLLANDTVKDKLLELCIKLNVSTRETGELMAQGCKIQ